MAATSECPTCGREVASGALCPTCHPTTGTSPAESSAPLPPPDPTDVRESPQPDTQPVEIVPGASDDELPDTQPVDVVPGASDDELPDTQPIDVVGTAAATGQAHEEMSEPDEPDETDQEDGEPTGEHEVITTETPPVVAATGPPSMPDAPAPAPAPAMQPPVTDTVPVTTLQPIGVFDGDPEEFQHTAGRHPFRVTLLLVLAVFGALAAVMVPASDIIDIRTTRPIDGIGVGIVSLDDVGTNLAIAGYVGAGAMILGAVMGSFGFRWGAGIAGGAGLALIGWAGVTLGLGEVPISQAEAITRTSTQEFTLRVTRDVGYWLLVGVAALGLLVFLASLRSSGRGGRRGLDPWIAALGALSALTLAIGPLIPVNDAEFSNNWQSTTATGDLPTLYFTGRLTQVALIAFAGVVGFLLVRAWGLGLAACGVSVATWMWFSSASEIGDKPIGVGIGNFGARDTAPHAVTTVGMVATIVMLLAAATAATIRFSRDRTV